MSGTISSFLKIKPKKDTTKEFKCVIQGQEVEFVLKTLDPELLTDIQIKNMMTIPSTDVNLEGTQGVNPITLAQDVLYQAIVEPNLNLKELQDHFNSFTPQECLHNMFKNDSQALIKLFNDFIEFQGDNVSKLESGTNANDVYTAKN